MISTYLGRKYPKSKTTDAPPTYLISVSEVKKSPPSPPEKGVSSQWEVTKHPTVTRYQRRPRSAAIAYTTHHLYTSQVRQMSRSSPPRSIEKMPLSEQQVFSESTLPRAAGKALALSKARLPTSSPLPPSPAARARVEWSGVESAFASRLYLTQKPKEDSADGT